MSKDGGAPPENSPGSGDPNSKKEEVYESRRHKQIIRIITVMAYMFAVSSMGMTLSGYYLFIWQPPNPKLIPHTRRLIADPPLELSLPAPMALKSSSPVGEPIDLTSKTIVNFKTKTPKPPTHDFETFSRANVVGGIFLQKLMTRNLIRNENVQVSSMMESDINDTSTTTEEVVTRSTILSDVLKVSSTVKEGVVYEDERVAIESRQPNNDSDFRN